MIWKALVWGVSRDLVLNKTSIENRAFLSDRLYKDNFISDKYVHSGYLIHEVSNKTKKNSHILLSRLLSYIGPT